jgi:hypothetical protein
MTVQPHKHGATILLDDNADSMAVMLWLIMFQFEGLCIQTVDHIYNQYRLEQNFGT